MHTRGTEVGVSYYFGSFPVLQNVYVSSAHCKGMPSTADGYSDNVGAYRYVIAQNGPVSDYFGKAEFTDFTMMPLDGSSCP